MQAKNKPAPTAAERAHIERVKSLPCVVCWAPPPSECHEIEQGQWFTSVALCSDCHRGSHNGIHGRRAILIEKRESQCSHIATRLAQGDLLMDNVGVKGPSRPAGEGPL